MDQDNRSPEQIKLDQMQEKLREYYLAIPMPIMMNPELSLADKVVYGRAYSFESLFESPTQTSMALGISADQVRKSKRKLENLGLLRCIKETYYGKAFVAVEDFHNPLGKNHNPLGKNHNPLGKISQPPCEKFTTENKERLKEEEKEKEDSLKDKSFKEAPEAPASEPLKEEPEQPARYGKAEINELLDLWQEQTGFSHHGTKAERYAINNLLRKNGYEATKALIRRVGTARRSDDQFAPQIAKPSQLQGKYSKLEALTMWEERQHKQTEDTNHPDFNLLYPVAHLDDYDYRGDKTKEELHADAQSIRDKWAGTKYERIFKRRSADEGEEDA